MFRAVGVPLDLPADILRVTDRGLEDILLGNARADLERLTKDIPPTRIETITAELATPWDVLGTTAAKVVNHADRNVLVVRAPR